MKNETIILKFINGEVKGRTKNLFIEGEVLYSYGYHFPLCLRLNDLNGGYKFIVNKSKYSMTTSRHQGYLRRNLKETDILETITLSEITKIIKEYPKITNTDEFILFKTREDTKK